MKVLLAIDASGASQYVIAEAVSPSMACRHRALRSVRC